MGILETRNLDFENVLILSANDDTFPGNLAAGASFIPHNLRLAYGLPTPMHHEGVYAYYFYRLLQRASVVDIADCSRSDDKHTGEPSRYIYQLDYESPHDGGADSGAAQRKPHPATLARSAQLAGEVAERLHAFLDGGGRTFSPTSFYAYIECPLKFCFRSIERLRPEEEVAEEIDLPMFGTILHKAMELLYTPLLNVPVPGRQIRALIGSAAVADAVTQAVSGEYLRDPVAWQRRNTAGMSCWCEISSHVISIVASCPMTPLIQAFGSKVWSSRSRPRSSSVWVVKHIP